jgi:hypothetical protein
MQPTFAVTKLEGATGTTIDSGYIIKRVGVDEEGNQIETVIGDEEYISETTTYKLYIGTEESNYWADSETITASIDSGILEKEYYIYYSGESLGNLPADDNTEYSDYELTDKTKKVWGTLKVKSPEKPLDYWPKYGDNHKLWRASAQIWKRASGEPHTVFTDPA